jgi:predicted dehydrogenase
VKAKANLKAAYSRSKATASTLVTEAQKLGYASVDLYSEDTAGHTLDDLLKRDDIKAVVIVLPILVQPDIIRRCFAAGKHVLTEKPLAKDVQTGRLLIEDYKKLYASKGIIFSVAEQFRFMPEFELGRKWIVDEKAVGDITQLHLKLWRNQEPGGKYYETPWRKVPEYQGGFLLDGGVHHAAMIRYVSGQEVVETHGLARQVAAHLPPLDTVNAGILLSGGGTGTISMSFASTTRATEFTIVGTKGSFFLTDGPDGFVLKLSLLSGTTREETIRSKGVELEINAFLEAVRTGKAQSRSGPEEALNDVAIIESLCSGGGKVNLY